MNTIGIALVWCVVQVTLLGLLVGALCLVTRWLRPAAAASVVLAGLAMIVVLSLATFSPWPCWSLVTGAFWPAAATVASPGEEDAVPSGSDADAVPGPATEVSVGDQEAWQPPRPAIGQTLRRLIAEELVAPSPADLASGWRWPAVVGAMLLAVMILGLGWLVLGLLGVRWQRRSSQPVRDRELTELVDVLCAELCCRRRIEIRECDNLVTAAMIGWRRPTLLVPPDWRTWSEDERRAVLAHEIAHARGHDCLGTLCGQLALMLHVYHPLLHWLASRLRLEQELAADAVAASITGGQRRYLATIAQLALRQPERPLLWPARTFLPTRTTFMRRIAMLRDNKLPVGRPSPAARLMVAGIVLLGGLLVAGLRGPASHEQAWAADESRSGASDGAQLTQQGWQLFGRRQMAEAKTKFEKAVKLSPENAAAWNGLGWASFHCGDAAQAEKAFKRTLELAPNAAAALNGLGQLYLSQRKYDEAEKWLLQAAPDSPAAWYGLTRLYLIQGKFEQAQKWAQKIVDSGEADDFARKMLQAAKDKKLSDSLRAIIEPPARPASAGRAAAGAARVSSVNAAAELSLVNADMELGDDSPAGWKQVGEVPGVKYLWDKTSGHGSSRSLCLHKTAARYFPIAQWSQSVPNPKTTSKLRVSAWVKTEKATKGILDVQFLNPDDSAHSWSHQWVAYIGARQPNAPPLSHDWTRYAGIVEIPSGTKTLGIGLQIYGPGKIWFDDVRAEFVPDATPKTDALLVQPGDEKPAEAPSKSD